MVHRRLLTLAAASIVIAFLVMALKYVAFHITGSVALFSDAAESIVNVITATVALWAIWLSGKPADAQHPFGHSKAEYFSAVLEGVLIVVAALVILHEAYGAFFNPRALNAPIQGMALNGIATLINAAWSAFLINVGRRLRSPALEADGRHILSDVVTSVGVLVGVGEAHVICDRLEDALHEHIKNCSVTIHVEPEGEARHKGVVIV